MFCLDRLQHINQCICALQTISLLIKDIVTGIKIFCHLQTSCCSDEQIYRKYLNLYVIDFSKNLEYNLLILESLTLTCLLLSKVGREAENFSTTKCRKIFLHHKLSTFNNGNWYLTQQQCVHKMPEPEVSIFIELNKDKMEGNGDCCRSWSTNFLWPSPSPEPSSVTSP